MYINRTFGVTLRVQMCAGLFESEDEKKTWAFKIGHKFSIIVRIYRMSNIR